MSGTQPGEPIRCVVFFASLRAASFHTVLAHLAAGEIEARGGRVDLAAMLDFDSPSYDQDVQFESGFPRVGAASTAARCAAKMVRSASSTCGGG